MLIISELLELIFNHFICQCPEQSTFIQILKGKVFKIKFLELQHPIILYVDKKQIHIFNIWHDQLDCVIQLQLNDLFLLVVNECTVKRFSSIPFEIKGDLKTTQDLIKIIDYVKLNFEKSFFINTHNIIFSKIHQISKYIFEFFKKKNEVMQLCLNSAIFDEWKLIPGQLELLWFYKDIDNLKIQEESLFKRLKALERYNGF